MNQSKETTRGVKNLIAFYEAMSSDDNKIKVLNKEKVISKVPEKIVEPKLTDKTTILTKKDNNKEKTEIKVDVNKLIINLENQIEYKKSETIGDQFDKVKSNCEGETIEDYKGKTDENIKNITNRNKNFNQLNYNNGISIEEDVKSKTIDGKNLEYNENDVNLVKVNKNNVDKTFKHHEIDIYSESDYERLFEKASIDTKNIPGVENSIEKFNKNLENSSIKEKLIIQDKVSSNSRILDLERNSICENSKNIKVCDHVKYEIDKKKENVDEDDDSLEFWVDEVKRRVKIFNEQKLASSQNKILKDDQNYKKSEKIIKIRSESQKLNEELKTTSIENSLEEMNDGEKECEDELKIIQTEQVPIENLQEEMNDGEKECEDELKIIGTEHVPIEDSPKYKYNEKIENLAQSIDKLAENISKEDATNSSEILAMRKIGPSNEPPNILSKSKNFTNVESLERLQLPREPDYFTSEASSREIERAPKIQIKYLKVIVLLSEIHKKSENIKIKHKLFEDETNNDQPILSKIQLDSSGVLAKSQSPNNDFNNENTGNPNKKITQGYESLKSTDLAFKTENKEGVKPNLRNKNKTYYEKANRNARDIIKAHVIENGFFSGLWSTIKNELYCCLGEQNNTDSADHGIYNLIDHITDNCSDRNDLLNYPCEYNQNFLLLNSIRRNKDIDFHEFNLNQCISALKKYMRDDLDGLLDAEMSKIILCDLLDRGEEGEKLIHEYGKLIMSRDRLIILIKLLKMIIDINNNESGVGYNELIDEFSPYIFTLGEVSKVSGENVIKAVRLICDPYDLGMIEKVIDIDFLNES
ncbi:hypothetical protein DMUE_2579 [Dictyocoela muelleri]|nr:hypothetical protein DMUE_2579 [Dictyocoela muelleri]